MVQEICRIQRGLSDKRLLEHVKGRYQDRQKREGKIEEWNCTGMLRRRSS